MPGDPSLIVADTPPAPGVADGGHLDAVVISDLHLGAHNCLAGPLADFLEDILDGSLTTRRLVINGDAFDSMNFRRLRKSHWRVLHLIRRLATRIEVTWVAGNHDGPAPELSHLLGVSVTDDCVLESGDRRILVCHGHVFDEFIDKYPVVSVMADWGYFFLQWVDSTHRAARLAKRATKVYLRCQERIARGAAALARRRGCEAVICGHTHQAVSSVHDGITYYNSGCWTERPPGYLAISGGDVEVRRYRETHEPAAAGGSGTVPLPGGSFRGAPARRRPLVAGSTGAPA
jgi:UDP-2,3-diacylglucosamine pyrophosphatase LpxH